MLITEIEKQLEEAIKYWSNKDGKKVDFLKCLLEISKTNKINEHKHVYALLEGFGEQAGGQEYAEIKLLIK